MRSYLVVALLFFVGCLFGQSAAELSKSAEQAADKNDFKAALSLIDKAIATNPSVPEYYYNRAVYLNKTEEYTVGMRQADTIPLMFPGSVDAYLYAADFALVNTVDIDKARRLCDTAIVMCNTSDSLYGELPMLKDGLMQTLRIYVLNILGANPDSAFSGYVVPDSVNAIFLGHIAFLYDDNKLARHAINIMKRGVELDPKVDFGFNNLGFYYNKIGEYTTAIDWFNKSIEFNKSKKGKTHKTATGFSYSNRGYSKFMLGNAKGALKDYKAAKEFTPNDSYLYYYYALLYISQNKTKKTCESLKKARALGFKRTYGDEVDKLIEQYCK